MPLAQTVALLQSAALLTLFVFAGQSVDAQSAPQRPAILGPETGMHISYDCGSLDAGLLAQLGAVKTLCPLYIQGGPALEEVGLRGDEMLIALDKNNAVVAIHEKATNDTDTFSGAIDHADHSGDIIYWGLWHQGTLSTLKTKRASVLSESRAIPYIAGVSAHEVAANDRMARRSTRYLSDLPTEGTAEYTLIGDAGAVSSKATYGDPNVPAGSVQSAHAVIDFKGHTGHLDLSIVVRGTTAKLSLPLKAASGALGFNGGAESVDPPCQSGEQCPHAIVQFYGRDGEFLGVTFLYADNLVLPEAARNAAKLSNVFTSGAAVLKKQ